MNKRSLRAGFSLTTCALLVVLAACSRNSTEEAPRSFGLEPLAPCTVAGTPFVGKNLDQAGQLYHSTVNNVIEAHLGGLGPLNCSEQNFAQMNKPSDTLKTLAAQLPPWQSASRLDKLSEADFGTVLLEFLRTYECTLEERSKFLAVILVDEGATTQAQVDKLSRVQKAQIANEILIARPTLTRVLTLVGGIMRLRPLRAEMECLSRTALDMRNAFGLIAETSACLTRIGDARESLRTPSSEQGNFVASAQSSSFSIFPPMSAASLAP